MNNNLVLRLQWRYRERIIEVELHHYKILFVFSDVPGEVDMTYIECIIIEVSVLCGNNVHVPHGLI